MVFKQSLDVDVNVELFSVDEPYLEMFSKIIGRIVLAQHIDIAKLEKRSRLIMAAVLGVGMLVLLLAVILADLYEEKQRTKSINQHLQKIIEHSIEQSIENHQQLLRRMLLFGDIGKNVAEKNREALIDQLSPRWERFKSENPWLNVGHIHLSDGTSLLRLHEPEKFGDDLSEVRPMAAQMHREHKPLFGYETGKYGTTFRVMEPIFYMKKYVGFIEMGVHPDYFIDIVRKITDFDGAMLVKQKSLELFRKRRDGLFALHDYVLRSKSDDLIIACLETASHRQMDMKHYHNQLECDGSQWVMHRTDLKSFDGEVDAILLFFQPTEALNSMRRLMILGVTIVFAMMTWLMFFGLQRQFRKAGRSMKALYDEHLYKIQESRRDSLQKQQYLETVFKTTPSIMFVTSGEQVSRVNQAFLDFVDCDDMAAFSAEHRCICELFSDKPGYLHERMGEMTWAEYVMSHPDKRHKVLIEKNGEAHVLQVNIGSFVDDDMRKYLCILTDVTALEQVNERYQFALQGAYDGLWDWNLASNTIYFSTRWKNMLGYDDAEIGSDFDEFTSRVHPDDMKVVMAAVDRHVKKAEPYEITFRMKHKDGRWIWILSRGQLVEFDDQDRPLRMVGVHNDITLRKQLETRLRQSQRRFELFMENTPALISIKGSDDKILYANSAMRDWVGKQEIIGRFIDEVLPAEQMAKIHELTQRVLKQRYVETQFTFTRKDGVERILRAHAFLMPGEHDSPSVGSIILDVTNQTQAESELHKLRNVIDNATVSIVITDLGGNIEYINPYGCKISGYAYEDAIGQNTNVFRSGQTSDEEYAKLWATIRNGQTWNGTFHNVKKNGELYWESATIAPIKDHFGNITNYIGIKQEISEAMRLREKLQENEDLMIIQSRHAAMGEMIGMIAHQWRQPITVIAMGANNILADVAMEELDPAGCKEQAQAIVKQTMHLSKTIDDFRNFFRPDREKEMIDVCRAFQEALGIVEAGLKSNGIKLTVVCDESIELLTYSRELMQVFINILNNSKEALVEHRDADRYIKVNIRQEEAVAVVQIADNGGGIGEEHIDSIFDPYFSTKSEKNGTGLGLYMCKTIVMKHLGGSIGASSDSVGAVFTIKIPFEEGKEKS